MKRPALLFLFLTTILFVTLASGAGPGIVNPKVKWKFKTQGPVRGSAIVDAGKIYFASADGFLYALNKNNGDLAGKFQTQGSISSTPSLSELLVFVSSNDNFVYALNSTTGQLVWQFQMQALMPSYWEWEYYTAAPVVSSGRVYIGSGDGNLYVLSANQGKLLWKFKTNGRIRAAPLVIRETVYLASNDGVLYVITAADGKLLWQFETEGANLDSRKFGWDRNSIYTTPVLQDRILVIGSRDGKTYAVNVNTHKEKWRFTYGPTWAMSAAVENGVVFVGWSDNSLLSAIDLQSGKEKWKFQSGSLVYTKPFLTEQEVFIGSADEKVYCLDKYTGEKKWEYQTEGCVYSSPLVNTNTLFIGSDDGYLYAIEEGPKPLKAVYYPIVKNKMMEGIFTVDKKITPYLMEQGFEQLDSAKLYHFLSDRIRDLAPSVIVFAYDMIPSNMVGEYPEKGMVRKYLEAGGKIIWFGNTPNLYKFDEKGNPTMDISIATRMLEVEFVRLEESGNYYSKSTQTGLNWGLPAWLTITYATVGEKGITPLAYDEYNRVSAWLKKFNPRPGSGFISCRTWGWYAPIHDEDLRLIYKLAMHELE
jgi:outer membrane protein assembly factor BamB